ncbi:histidinol phosphate aminotransferase, partial [Porphyromonas gulae]
IRFAVYRNGQKVDDTTSPSTPSEGGGEQGSGGDGL